MPDESMEYRDHRLDVYRFGPGWRVFIEPWDTGPREKPCRLTVPEKPLP